MLNRENKILNYFYGHKPIKVTLVIDIDFETILEKTGFCDNNPEVSAEINKHIACYLSIFVKYKYSNSKQKQYFIEKIII